MNKKQGLILFIICLIPFLFYFVHPLLHYFDSYAFLAGSCGIDTGFVIPFIPCNIFLIKLLLFFCFLVATFSISIFGEQIIGKKLGWRVGLFAVAFCPLFFREIVKFENDVFGWTLAFVGLAVFSIGLTNKKHLYKALLMFFGYLIVIISIFMWFATYLMLLSLFLLSVYTYVFVIIGLIPITQQIIPRINNVFQTTQKKILEEIPLIGIFGILPFLLGLKFTPKKILLPTILLFAAGLIQNKFMILTIPFLAIGFTLFFEKLEKLRWIPNYLILCLLAVSIFGFLSLSVSPTQQEMNLVEESIIFSQDNNLELYNDWTYGWWLTYKGFDTNFKSSYPNPDYDNIEKPFVALTQQDLNCLIIKKENNMNLFKC
jgi:hypothetical protein